jgi:hypothetical protein
MEQLIDTMTNEIHAVNCTRAAMRVTLNRYKAEFAKDRLKVNHSPEDLKQACKDLATELNMDTHAKPLIHKQLQKGARVIVANRKDEGVGVITKVCTDNYYNVLFRSFKEVLPETLYVHVSGLSTYRPMYRDGDTVRVKQDPLKWTIKGIRNEKCLLERIKHFKKETYWVKMRKLTKIPESVVQGNILKDLNDKLAKEPVFTLQFAVGDTVRIRNTDTTGIVKGVRVGGDEVRKYTVEYKRDGFTCMCDNLEAHNLVLTTVKTKEPYRYKLGDTVRVLSRNITGTIVVTSTNCSRCPIIETTYCVMYPGPAAPPPFCGTMKQIDGVQADDLELIKSGPKYSVGQQVKLLSPIMFSTNRVLVPTGTCGSIAQVYCHGAIKYDVRFPKQGRFIRLPEEDLAPV